MRIEWNKRFENFSYDTEEGLWAWACGNYFSLSLTKRSRGFHTWWNCRYDGIPYSDISIGKLSIFFGEFANAKYFECDYWVWDEDGELDKNKSKWKD